MTAVDKNTIISTQGVIKKNKKQKNPYFNWSSLWCRWQGRIHGQKIHRGENIKGLLAYWKLYTIWAGFLENVFVEKSFSSLFNSFEMYLNFIISFHPCACLGMRMGFEISTPKLESDPPFSVKLYNCVFAYIDIPSVEVHNQNIAPYHFMTKKFP